MNAPEQLTMFEPTGDELASLARQSLAAADSFKRQADNLASRMFVFAARAFDQQARQAIDRAQVFEAAYQFERLAGLS